MAAEWKKAPEFAEVAEALGINTSEIMAMMPNRAVMYTPHPDDDDPMICLSLMGRDADGILRPGPPRDVARTSEFVAQIDTLMEEMMKEVDDGS